ncbi:MAG: preprotein translocase subunit YajC [Actinomycetota bacterium]|jgi:preprotein translocase subunit YajC
MGQSGFLLVIVAFAFLYFVLVRPQKRRQVEQARLLGSLEVGDEVVTAGGIYGHITSIDGDDLMVQIAPQLEVRVARRAIGGVVKPEEEADAAEPDDTEPAEAAPRDAGETPIAGDGG